MYYGQTGVVRERDVDSCGFDIRGSVRQGCVLSLRLFRVFFSFIRLVYGDTWAGKANGVINLAAENKMRELSGAT